MFASRLKVFNSKEKSDDKVLKVFLEFQKIIGVGSICLYRFE